MAGFFQRLFKIGQSEAHAVLDNMEDPIRLTEQGIRDLKKDLQSSMTSLAEVKAIAIRLKKDGEGNKTVAADYERKAMLLLQKVEKSELEQEEAERLATEALKKKAESAQTAAQALKDWKRQDAMANELQGKIEQLKSTITKYENDLVTLKARARTAASTKKINQQLAKIDSSSTIALLEKMRTKVQEDESLAEAYGSMADVDKTVDTEIDAALTSGNDVAANESLAQLKAKMGMAA